MTPELTMANRALTEADEAMDAYWSRPLGDLDSRLADAELAISSLRQGFMILLAVMERQMRVRS